MNSVVILFIAFACVFGAGLLGMFLHAVLPKPHLSGDSKDAVRLGIGVIATMAALALGLLVSSAKTFYDTQSSELTQLSANVILLDRVLAHYGPETKEARDSLRAAVDRTLDLMCTKINDIPKWNRERAAATFSMIKSRRCPRRTKRNTHPEPKRQAWPLISENCVG